MEKFPFQHTIQIIRKNLHHAIKNEKPEIQSHMNNFEKEFDLNPEYSAQQWTKITVYDSYAELYHPDNYINPVSVSISNGKVRSVHWNTEHKETLVDFLKKQFYTQRQKENMEYSKTVEFINTFLKHAIKEDRIVSGPYHNSEHRYELNSQYSPQKWTSMSVYDSYTDPADPTETRYPVTVSLSNDAGKTLRWNTRQKETLEDFLKQQFLSEEEKKVIFMQEAARRSNADKKKEIMKQAEPEVDEVIDDWFPGLVFNCKNRSCLQDARKAGIISDTEILDLIVQRFTLAAKKPFKPIEEIKADILQTFSCRITALERRFGVS